MDNKTTNLNISRTYQQIIGGLQNNKPSSAPTTNTHAPP